MAHFHTVRLPNLSVSKNRTKQSSYDYSSLCDQTKDDPGLDQAWQTYGSHPVDCGQ